MIDLPFHTHYLCSKPLIRFSLIIKKEKKHTFIKDQFQFTLKCRDRLYNISDIEGEHSELYNKCFRKEKIK